MASHSDTAGAGEGVGPKCFQMLPRYGNLVG